MRTQLRAAAGVLIGLSALAAAFVFPYSLISEYGGFGPSVAWVAAVATPLAGLGLWLVNRKPLPALLVAAALSLVAALGGGLLGQRAHQHNQEAIAAACSPAERAELQALGVVPTDGAYGTGSSDGSCSGMLGTRTTAAAEAALSSGGWTRTGSDGVYSRNGLTLLLVVEDEGAKGQNVTLRFPSDGRGA